MDTVTRGPDATPPTFGVEEEYLFVRPDSLEPADESSAVLASLRDDSLAGTLVHPEFLASQLEYSSPVFGDVETASIRLGAFRRTLATAATKRGLLVASVGSPFTTHGMPTLTPDVRYRRIAAEFGGVVAEHQITALHVHVAVPDRELGVAALNRIRPWLPTLTALSTNSPFHHGADSGFASWRSILMRRWTTAGPPPEFLNAADYDRRANALIGVGGTLDLASIAWSARLSETHPTVEVRACDAQLEVMDSIVLAAVIRALVTTAIEQAAHGRNPIRCDPEQLDAAHWHAARHGIATDLVDPIACALAPASEVVHGMLAWCSSALATAGDEDLVRARVSGLLREGTGADRQRAAFASGGITGLSTLLRKTFVSAPVTPHRGASVSSS